MHRNVRSRPLVLMAAALAALCAFVAEASAETRTLKLHHLHTHEKAEIAFKRNGRYLPDGLRKINLFLRDWRRNEPTKMDPRLLDLVWEAYRESGSSAYINVVSAYRAPATNAMLRGRSKGVAKNSQHMLGKAMDFFIPGVPLKKLRDIGLRIQGGGVGYYPTSGSPFVHLDVGNVRHWPGISRQELVRVFPNGKTLHVPSDGKPLPGYEQAVAAYKTRRSAGTPNIEMASLTGGKRRSGGLLAAFFGGGVDEEEDNGASTAAARPAAKPAAAPAPAPAPSIAIVPPDKARRLELPEPAQAAPAAPAPTETIVAALPQREVPLPSLAPRPSVGLTAEVADDAPVPAAVPEPEATVAIAAPARVPLPTWRPQGAPASADEQVLLAMASAGDGAAPAPQGAAEAAPAPAYVAVAIPEQAPVPGLLGARAVAPATGPDSAAATTDKRARPLPSDGRAAPKSLAVPPLPGAWPLRTASHARPAPAAEPAVRLAASFLRQAPDQVYVEGFRRDRTPADHRRFTGSAVNFLPIASFR